MSADALVLVPGFVCLVFAYRCGLIVPMWNAIKSALMWVLTPRKIQRRTPNQIRFKTDMKWHEIRWSIARIEHELYPEGGWAWTHDVADCVDVNCNPEFLRVMVDRQGNEYITKRPFTAATAPVLPKPPPPPPPSSRAPGGPTTARTAPNPMSGSPEKH